MTNDREAIARVIYEVENEWIRPNFPPSWIPRDFDELQQFERDLHYAYADAVLALPKRQRQEEK